MNVDIGVAIAGKLQSTTEITDITETRIYSDVVPQTSAVPAILLRIISEVPHNTLSGPLGMDRARVQIDSYGRTRPEANELAWYVWTTLWSADPQVLGNVHVMEVSRDSGIRYSNDRPETGSDQVRFLSSQDFLVSYVSCEVA